MAKSDEDITKNLGDKKWVLTVGALGLLFTIALIAIIILFGALAGDPRGEIVGPGP